MWVYGQDPGTVSLIFLVSQVARDQGFLRFLPVSIIPPLLHTHISFIEEHCFVHFSLLTVGIQELGTLPTLCS